MRVGTGIDIRKATAEFRKCLEHFTTQKPELVLRENENLFEYDENNNLVVDEGSGFWDAHPAIRWGVKKVAQVFVQYYPKHDRKDICRFAEIQIIRELESLTHGLDWDLVNAIGAERYESKAGEGIGLILLPYYVEPSALHGQVLFHKEMRTLLCMENVHALRKQLNMTCNGYLIVAYLGGEKEPGFYSIGIGDGSLAKRFPRIVFTGHMEWSYCLPPAGGSDTDDRADCRIHFGSGRLLLPMLGYQELYSGKITEDIKNTGLRDTALKVIGKLDDPKQKNGAIIVMSERDVIKRMSHRLCLEKKRGFLLEQPCNCTGSTGSEVLRQLTSVDGALLVDANGDCFAFGVILDGQAKLAGDMSRGARYNTTNNFVHLEKNKYHGKPVLAIVLSEDGMLDVFT